MIEGELDFNRDLIHHQRKIIAVKINGPCQLSRGQVVCDFTSQDHKKGVLQSLLSVPSVGLEPQELHHLRGTWCFLD